MTKDSTTTWTLAIADDEEDLATLEKKMNELARQNNAYQRIDKSKAEAVAYFTDKGDEYKLDLLQNLEDGNITFYTQVISPTSAAGRIYQLPVPSKPSNLPARSGRLLESDEKNKQLTRVYGITFPQQKNSMNTGECSKKPKTGSPQAG